LCIPNIKPPPFEIFKNYTGFKKFRKNKGFLQKPQVLSDKKDKNIFMINKKIAFKIILKAI